MKVPPSNRSAETAIELVPARVPRHWSKVLTRWLSRVGIFAAAAFALLILLRLALAAYFYSRASDATGELARASGMDGAIARWLEGPAAWLLALALAGIGWQLLAAFFWPFSRTQKQWRTMLVVLCLSGAGVILPVMIRSIRGLDAGGLPAAMVEVSEPARVQWFEPDGQALLAFSREPDGSLRFWNRPGKTPDRALEAAPVTREIRAEWERMENTRLLAERARKDFEAAAAAKRAAEEKAVAEEKRREAERRAADQRAAEESAAALQRAREQDRRAAEEAERLRSEIQLEQALSTAPVPRVVSQPRPSEITSDGTEDSRQTERFGASAPEPALEPWRSYQLHPGSWLRVYAHGRPSIIRADQPIEVFANDPRARRYILQPGRTLSFRPGTRTIHAQPLFGRLGTLQVRNLD